MKHARRQYANKTQLLNKLPNMLEVGIFERSEWLLTSSLSFKMMGILYLSTGEHVDTSPRLATSAVTVFPVGSLIVSSQTS